MTVARKLLRGSLLRNLEFFMMVGITFIMTPFIIHTLGERMYGFWALVGAFIGYYGLLDFGLSSAVSRFVSRGLGQNDLDDVRKVVSTSLAVMMLISLIALIITGCAALFCPFFIDDTEEISLFRLIIALMGSSVAIGFPLRVFGGILNSHLRYDYITIISIIRMIAVNFFIYFLLVESSSKLLTLTLINIGGNIFQYLALAVYCRVAYSEIPVSLKYYDKNKIKVLFNYSGKTFVARLADILRFRVDSFVIAGFLNLGLVAYYSVAARLMDYFVKFILSSVGILGPYYSQLEGSGDMAAVKKTFLNATRVSIILCVFIGASIVFYGKSFIYLWMGPGFSVSYEVLIILIAGYVTALCQSSAVGMLYGISKHSYFMYSNIFEGFLNLILSIFFVRHLGIYGVAVGTSMSMLLVKLFIQPWYVCKVIDYSIVEYYFRLLIPTFTKCLLPLLLYFSIVNRLSLNSYIVIIILSFLQSVVYLVYVYFCVFNVDDKALLRRALNV